MTDAIKAKLKYDLEIASNGRDEIARLCDNKNYQWTMRIPANERDSDLVLLAPIEKLESRVKALEVAVEALREIDYADRHGGINQFPHVYEMTEKAISEIARLLGVGE